VFTNTYRGFLGFCRTVGLNLEPFQKRIARAVFDGQRELLVLLPKGNGKTTLMAAVAVHHLLANPNPSIYCGAASVAQARILFEAARDMSKRIPGGEVVIRALELRREDGGGVLRMVPSDGPRTHGISPTLAVCDELWAHRDGALYESMRAAMVKRADMKLITISTADIGEDRPLCKLRARALALPTVERTGGCVEATGERLRALLWEVADSTGADDMKSIAAVNPASWITTAALADQRQSLPEGAFLRFHANQRVGKDGAWIPPGAWQRIVGAPKFEPGERVVVALDVGGGGESVTALTWINEALQVGSWIGYGDDSILGARDRLAELREEFTISEVTADRWQAKQLLAELEAEGMICVEFPQTDVRMIPASARLREAVVDQRLTVPADPELSRHAANAIQRQTRRGWRIDKPDRKSPMDAMVTLAMALDRVEVRPEPVRLVGWV
jgi:phage terminase large subunit-like protein